MRRKVFLPLLMAAALLVSFLPARAAPPEELRLPVIMYHHISKHPENWNDYVISQEEFAADLDYLAEKGYETVSVAQLLAWKSGRFQMPEKPFMITFDDGFESTLAYAEPIVAAHGFTAVVAVIGSVCEKFSLCGEHDPELSNLSWEDAAALAERGVFEVQCHTWDMHALSPRKGCGRCPSESEEEYAAALAGDLKTFLRKSAEMGLDCVPSIAYPYGCFGPETTETVKQLGFRAAFTCTERVNILTGNPEELYSLGRFNRTHGLSQWEMFSPWEKAG